MKYEDFLVSSLGKGGVVSPLRHTRHAENPVYKFVDDKNEFYTMYLYTITRNVLRPEKFLSHSKKQDREKISISNQLKLKSVLSLAVDYAPE